MKNLKAKIQNDKGITLVALVVTIIVLLILAGVSISAVFSQQGIFNRAENAVDKHSQSKARETLDLVFSEAQMKKYDEGLTDDELNKMIEGVGQLLPKEDPESKYQLVIVDGYIFEIDRSVPKVVDYKGPADGIIITATISGNNGWVRPGESVTVKGSIKIYGEGSIASSSATSTNSSVSLAGFPTKGGDFTISNITEDTDIKITATDSTGKKYEKIIQVVIKRDTTPPTITELKAEAEGLKIKISATGHDKNASGVEESGIKQFKYTITSTQDITLEGIPADKREGTFTQGKLAEITTTPTGNREETTYTISVTAIDNCDNKSTTTTKEVTAIDGITIAQARKEINASNLKDYIGKRVIDYTTDDSGVAWRIFYQDNENQGNGKGYFGDDVGTIYLKRDYDSLTNVTNISTYGSHTPSDGGVMMKQMNPKWRDSSYSTIDLENEHCVSWLCDPEEWKQYKTSEAKYAIGGTSVEMYMKAYNVYKKDGTALINKIGTEFGYYLGAHGDYLWNNSTEDYTGIGSVDDGRNYVFIGGPNTNGDGWVLCSPHGTPNPKAPHIHHVVAVQSGNHNITTGAWTGTMGICPIVALL